MNILIDFIATIFLANRFQPKTVKVVRQSYSEKKSVIKFRPAVSIFFPIFITIK